MRFSSLDSKEKNTLLLENMQNYNICIQTDAGKPLVRGI